MEITEEPIKTVEEHLKEIKARKEKCRAFRAAPKGWKTVLDGKGIFENV